MKEILKMLFELILFVDENVNEINDMDDLCDAALNPRKIIEIFAVMNDDQDGFSTEEILEIANEAYQEVCSNG